MTSTPWRWIFYRIGEETGDQGYCEEKQQLRVHQDRDVEGPGHDKLHGSWL
jgi:hypothetical protein